MANSQSRDALPESSRRPVATCPQSTETVPEVEEHPVLPTETEPWRPLTEAEKTAWDALSPEEREVCDALVHRLHRELGHSDIRGMVDSLRQNRAHPTVLAAAKLMQCTACQESARLMSRPVTSGKITEPGAVYWKHPTKEVHVKGTLLVDASSRAAVVRIWRAAPRQELLGNVSSLEARQMLQESWFKFYGRLETVMTDPEGCFRERLFQEWSASKNVKWDLQPAEAAWHIGKLDKVLDVLKNAATRAARRAPENTSCETLLDDCTEAHNELHRRRGYSPFQLLIGRSPPGLPLDGDKQLGEVSASLASDGRHRLHIQRECYRAYLDEDMSIQQRRREMHKSRPFRVWSSGDWCWFWRSRAQLHRRTKASRHFKEGAFLGPTRVLLQERERKADDTKYKAVVWIVDGDQLVLCSSAHLRPVSTAEQTLCSLRDGEARTFQQVVRELPKRNFVDLVGQPSPIEEDFEEPMDVAPSDEELLEDFWFFKMKRWHRLQRLRRQKLTTKSASTRAETPVAEATEPASVPLMPKDDQNQSIARLSTARPFSPQLSTVQQSSTLQPTTILPTDSPSRTEVLVEPMSQSQAMKRPLEQILQPESKRISLCEEHGILAVEDLRWLPRQRPRGVRCPLKCWNLDTAEGRGQVLNPCAQDEVVEVAFALSHHEAVKIAATPATALAALARQGRGEVRVSMLTPREREELVKAKQAEISSFLKHAAVEAATRSGLHCNSLM